MGGAPVVLITNLNYGTGTQPMQRKIEEGKEG